VLVLGTGGLNSTVIQHLAGLGVGRLLLPPVLALRERRLRRSGRLL
jgi:molybdopterin/thiamine biosynthesis adenylyltransferase